MAELALLDSGLPVPWRLRGRQLFAQPAVRRSLPMVAAATAVVVVALLWLGLRAPEMRPVFNGMAEADKAAVADALRAGNFRVAVDATTGAVEVPVDQVAAARIMLAGQGLPKAAPSGVSMLNAMPLGTSRAVEGAQLKAAQERDLAASIAAIDAVESAQVHLASTEPSVFIRDRAAPSASVFVTLASGRTLGEAQVRAIVHLVASSVAGLNPDAVSVVDQTGALLSGDRAGDLGETGRMLDAEARTAAVLRQRVVQLLTPIIGADNFSTQVSADLDFSENAATRESYDRDASAIASESGASSTEATPVPARGIPGALSNTIPQAAQVSNTPPAPSAPPVVGPSPQSQSFAKTYEVGKAVSVTRAARGSLRRLSVAVVIRDTSLGAVKGRAAQLASLEGLVRSAVGFDARRGDVVTLAARPFTELSAPPPGTWWQAWLAPVGTSLVVLIVVALLVFGVVRPWLRAQAAERDAVLAALPAPPVARLLDYGAKLEATRALVGGDADRAAAVVRGMMRA